MRPAALALFWALLGSAAHAQEELSRLVDGWSRYANARFGTILDVPTPLFAIVDPPPDNGDGRIFKAQDGAELRVFGSYDASTVTADFSEYKVWVLQQAREDGLKVSYKAQGKDWLAFSGFKDDTIAYGRIIEGCNATHEMRITYPAARKALYDPLVGRLSRSLKCKAAK